VHDPIFLRALVVDNGNNTAAIVAADLLEFGDIMAVRERVTQATGIPADYIIIAASHDHNAPRVGKVTAGAIRQVDGLATAPYTEGVYDQIVEVMRRAKERSSRLGLVLEPVRLMLIRIGMSLQLRVGSLVQTLMSLRIRLYGL